MFLALWPGGFSFSLRSDSWRQDKDKQNDPFHSLTVFDGGDRYGLLSITDLDEPSADSLRTVDALSLPCSILLLRRRLQPHHLPLQGYQPLPLRRHQPYLLLQR